MRVASSVGIGVLVQVFLQDVVLGRDVILFWSFNIKNIRFFLIYLESKNIAGIIYHQNLGSNLLSENTRFSPQANPSCS